MKIVTIIAVLIVAGLVYFFFFTPETEAPTAETVPTASGINDATDAIKDAVN